MQEELEEVEMLVDLHEEANSVMPTVVMRGNAEVGGRSRVESGGRSRVESGGRSKMESGGRSRVDRPTEEVDFGQIQEI